ncbi:MAG: DUF1566 domain-containing protein [Deferribacterales bacterium]
MKFLSYLAAVLMVLSIAACHGGDANSTTPAGSDEDQLIYVEDGTLSTTADADGAIVMESPDGERVVKVNISYHDGSPAANAEVEYFYSEDDDINILLVKDSEGNYRDFVYIFNSDGLSGSGLARAAEYSFTIRLSDIAPDDYTFEDDGFEIISIDFQDEEEAGNWSEAFCMTIAELADHVESTAGGLGNVAGFAVSADAEDGSAALLAADTEVADAAENAIEAAIEKAGVAVDLGAAYLVKYYTFGTLASSIDSLDLSSVDKDGMILPYIVTEDTEGACVTSSALVINGTPAASVPVGGTYSFVPGIVYSEGGTLTFSYEAGDDISGWASLNTETGELSGTPADADAGTYEDIVITVTDGNYTASLDAFSITVWKDVILQTGVSTYDVYYEDGDYEAGKERSYSRSNDVVADEVTGLMWQDDAAAGSTLSTYSAAADHCANNVSTGGYNDWRVPTLRELLTVVNYSKFLPAVDNAFFQNTASAAYWTSDSDSSSYYYVNMEYGVFATDSDGSKNLMCVRGNTTADKSFTRDDATSIVTDNGLGLMWFDYNTVPVDWTTSLNSCEGLNYNGYGDWRLPNINEMMSIQDTSSPTGFAPAFQSTGSDEYWTSTPYVGNAANIKWILDAVEKRTDQSLKTPNKQFRCVRGGEYNDFA